MLPDGNVVAIKKSEKMDEAQTEHFINEVVILSLINHRHVVKLLGCCLETEVALLVYELVSNGTLSKNIHDQMDEPLMKWLDRLKIAKDVAGAVAYMHSTVDVLIYHRVIKSSNILLDGKCSIRCEDMGLVAYFISSVKEKRLFDVLDPQIVSEGEKWEIVSLVNLAMRCLKLNGRKRPTMKEVSWELENILKRPKENLAVELSYQLQKKDYYFFMESSRPILDHGDECEEIRDELELDI